MKVVAYMNFFIELDLLEIKLREMSSFVETFVICEGDRTFTGLAKPYFFEQHRERFKEFPIDYVKVSLPGPSKPWERENFQLNSCGWRAQAMKPDVLIYSCVDEPVRASAVERFLKLNCPIASLEGDWLFYYFNRVRKEKWRARSICRDGKLHVWDEPGNPVIRDAGWHFCYIQPLPELLAKASATSHADEPGAELFRQALRRGEKPLLNLTEEYPMEKLPVWLAANKDRFKDLFL